MITATMVLLVVRSSDLHIVAIKLFLYRYILNIYMDRLV
jgi:hypothetical protein